MDSNSKTIFGDANEKNVTAVWKIAEVILNDMINMIDSAEKLADKEVYIKFPYKSPTTARGESMKFATESIFPFFKYLMKRKDI